MFLTIVTQVGGVAFLFSLLVFRRFKITNALKRLGAFVLFYSIFSFIITPALAPILGRERVQHSEKISPTNYITIILNRNYVRPQLNKLLQNVEKTLEGTQISIHYLDANFPFIDHFPLLPHLSHNDGKKLDLSLIYESEQGELSDKQKSMSGYGVFEEPKNSEHDQITFCKENGYFQYDFPKYLTFGEINKDLKFSEKGTKILLKAILQEQDLGKIFIEPHLKTRLNLTHPKIRYHGCGAVRHDDHIHIQLK